MRKLLATSILALASMLAVTAQSTRLNEGSWTTDFGLDLDDLASNGRNPFFVLEPGYTLVLEAGREQLTITVLNETRKIGRVDARVVEERETMDRQLVEVSRNYFAISRRTNSVFYFGEEVDIYRGGKIVRHEGAWLAGTNGARPGLMMPGLPLLHARYYQEIAPGVAMDLAEVVSMSETVRTPAGEFKNALKVSETTPLEPGTREYKWYAAGVGLLQDGALKLVRYGSAGASRD